MANQASHPCSPSSTVKSISTTVPSNNSKSSSVEIVRNSIETSKKSSLRVRFHTKVKVKSTIHLKHYTKQEIEACWYTSIEYSNIRKGLYSTLNLMKISLSPYNTLFSGGSNSSSSSSNDKEDNKSSLSSLYCTRGLENLSVESGLKHSTKNRRQNAIWSVLDEQYIQYEEAVLSQQRSLMYDVEKIRNVYKYHTQTSEMNARVKGRIDAEESYPSSTASSTSSSTSTLGQLIESENNMNMNNTDNDNEDEDDDASISSYSSLETTIASSASNTHSSSSPISIITYDGKINSSTTSSDNKKNHLSYRRGGARRLRWSFVNTRVQSCHPQCI